MASAPIAAAAVPTGSAEKKKRIVLRRYVAQEEKEKELQLKQQRKLLLAAAAAKPFAQEQQEEASLASPQQQQPTNVPESAEKRKRGGGERLNDAQRLEIIRLRRQDNPPSLRSLAREFRVTEKSIRNVMQSAAEIEKRNENVDVKQQTQTFRHAAPRHPELEEKVFEWICSLKKVQINPTPSAIIEKAKVIAAGLGIADAEFKGSAGWFERFRRRRRLSDMRMSVGGDDGAGDNDDDEENRDGDEEQQQSNDVSGNSAASTKRRNEHSVALAGSSNESVVGAVGVYDLLHRLVEFENNLRLFQRANPLEHDRAEQCLANASVIRHDLLAMHANMQVRTLRANNGASPQTTKSTRHHELQALI
uniref:HTH CENPB-type domain-containing protein n=1 Tax=Globisporangium ultimum (strain ATCC 200006 / CBS 805.95 / DAOM BR144) TaxID=431595 RepID=K3WER7_GLOUD